MWAWIYLFENEEMSCAVRNSLARCNQKPRFSTGRPQNCFLLTKGELWDVSSSWILIDRSGGVRHGGTAVVPLPGRNGPYPIVPFPRGADAGAYRSEERRVGKEWRSRWS